MRGGVSFPPGTNIVCVCGRIEWKAFSEQNKVIIHEVGHQLRMVTDGSKGLPARTPNHYTGRGHRGNHCHTGLPLKEYTPENAPDDASNAGCVMFGAVNTRKEFCTDCAEAIKKMDLSKGVQPGEQH